MTKTPSSKHLTAVVYNARFDGWSPVEHKHIRDPDDNHVIWMLNETFKILATAAHEGEFFIPCAVGCLTDDQLRAHVRKMEKDR